MIQRTRKNKLKLNFIEHSRKGFFSEQCNEYNKKNKDERSYRKSEGRGCRGGEVSEVSQKLNSVPTPTPSSLQFCAGDQFSRVPSARSTTYEKIEGCEQSTIKISVIIMDAEYAI